MRKSEYPLSASECSPRFGSRAGYIGWTYLSELLVRRPRSERERRKRLVQVPRRRRQLDSPERSVSPGADVARVSALR